MSDTPRTDALFDSILDGRDVNAAMTNLAYQLERELTSARKDQAILGFECQRLMAENQELKKRLAAVTDQ